MQRILYPTTLLWLTWHVGLGYNLHGQIDKIFSVLLNEGPGCDVTTLPQTVEWCNGTLNANDLLPDYTVCQSNDGSSYYTHLLCKSGIWWNGNKPFKHTRRSKRSGISAVVTLEKKESCTWICAIQESEMIGHRPPVFDYCPNSTVLYPEGNSTQVTHEWQTPIVKDVDGNVTGFEQIIGPASASVLEATKTPGSIYHVSYMAEDDEMLKWPCYFTINAEVPVCPAIVNFKHGYYSCDNDNLRGSTCIFQCEEGYYLNTTNSTICQDNGTWSFGNDMPECYPVSCGPLVASSPDIQFLCYEGSHEFASVCWARCKYGYILRNDKQEEEEIARLSELVDKAEQHVNDSERAREIAETLVQLAEDNLLVVQADTEKALTANTSTATALANAQEELNSLSVMYNHSYILALQALDDAEEAERNNATNAEELLAISENLTAVAEKLKVELDGANTTYQVATETALVAHRAASEEIDKLAAAEMYVNETENNFESAIEEEEDARKAYSDAMDMFNAAVLYSGRDDKIVNTFARCGADGTWMIPGEPFCIDTEPPLLKCIPIHNLYLEPGKSSVVGFWPLPELQEHVKDEANVIQVSGPANGTTLEAGQYLVTYIAIDLSGNTSPNCSVIINVEVISCTPVTEDESMDKNLIADCDSYISGSTCSLSCRSGFILEGNNWVTCEYNPSTTVKDFVWNFNETSCTEGYCPELAEPENGYIRCDNTTEGDSCNIICNENYTLPYKAPSVYNCGETGLWSPAQAPSGCIEESELQVTLYTLSITYLPGNASNECIQSDLDDEQMAMETALRSNLQTFSSCEEEYECMLKGTTIECSEEEDGLRTLTLDIITTCSDNEDIPCDLTQEIMTNFEADIRNSMEDMGILDHLNVTLITDWLKPVAVDFPECSTGSVLIRAYCERCDIGKFMEHSTKSCHPCPIGYYGDSPGLAMCLACPPGTNTTDTGRTSVNDCRELCPPGSYSPTAMVPCITCKSGTYQEQYGGIQCNMCPSDGTWTTFVGAESRDKCILFDMYFEKELPPQDIDIEIIEDMSAIFWVKGFDIPILTFGLFYDDTEYAFKLVTEENIQIFTDGWDNTPTGAMMASNEWIMLAVVWNALDKEIQLYKNGELVFTMYTKYNIDDPRKVKLSVKEETFLSGFVIFNYIVFPQVIETAYLECGTVPGVVYVLPYLAALHLEGLKAVPSTCQASKLTIRNNCDNHGCQNNGVCVHNDTYGYTCDCIGDYGGPFCEVELVHGDWSDWINATDCSVTCGTGLRAIYRLCNNPSPGLYGNDCEGNSTDFVECHLEACQECEIPSESIKDGTLCILENDECAPACREGRVLPKGQREQKFRCGVSTNYEWVPQNKLPICAKVFRPAKYVLEAVFQVRPAVPCQFLSNITFGYEIAAAALLCPTQNPNCVSRAKFEDCLEGTRRKRNTPTTSLILAFEVVLTSEVVFDLEEYFLTRNMTESILETVTAIYDMELTIKQILNTPELLDVLFLNVTYTIVPGSEQIIATTACLPNLVDTQGVCVECQPGTRQMNGWCVYCDIGSYQDSTGQSVCTPCPDGQTTIFLGARSAIECQDIITEAPPPAPLTTDVGPIIIIVVCAVAGIILVLVVVCTVLKFYIMSKRRQQYDMEAETTSLFTEFPDIAYNMYFKNRQVLGFDEKGLPLIAKSGVEDADTKSPFYDAEYLFGHKGEELPPLIPPLEPFSFSARPVKDMPFDHPPPNLKKKSFVKPSMDPSKHFNFPGAREIPVRFRVPKRKRFQNRYPRHTFGLPDEEEGYISQKVPVPKNATKLLYKSPTGENIYAYLFKDGLIRTVHADTGYVEEGVHPNLPLLKAQFLDEDGEFQHPPPVFEKLKTGDDAKVKLKKKTKGSAAGSRTSSDRLDSRPSTAMPGSRPSTTKSKGRSRGSPRSRLSPRSRGSPRSRASPRSRGISNMDSFRSTSSVNSLRGKSALPSSRSRSAKSFSIREHGYESRPTTAGTFLSQARSSRHSNERLFDVAETYRPKSISVMESPEDYPVLSTGLPLSIPTPIPEDQISIASSQLFKDQKMKFMAPPSSKTRPKSVTPVPAIDTRLPDREDGMTEYLETAVGGVEHARKEVHFNSENEEQPNDLEANDQDSDSSGSVIFTKNKTLTEKRHSRVSQMSVSRTSRVSVNVPVSRTPRSSVNGSVAARQSISKGIKAFRPSRDFTANLDLPMIPPRGHHLKAMAPPPAFIKENGINVLEDGVS